MSLADFQPETKNVALGKTSVAVRGLTFFDISKLIKTHYEDLGNVFDMYESSAGDDLSNIAMGKMAMTLVKDAPGLVAHIIALAADEEDFVNVVHKINFLKQLEILKAIGSLTFEEVGSVKKMIADVMELVANLKPDAPAPRSPAKKKR